MNSLIILSTNSTELLDRKLWKAISFWGADASLLEPGKALELAAQCANGTSSVFNLCMHADTFTSFGDRGSLHEALQTILHAGGNIFIYGCSQKTSAKSLETLSDGRVTGLVTGESCELAHLPLEGKRWSKQLAGADFPRGTSMNSSQDVFNLAHGVGPSSNVFSLITLAGKPAFLSFQVGNGHVFLSSIAESPDFDEYVANEQTVESFYDSVLPALIFIRFTCQEFCWHGGYPAARLIIDDPVLRPKYGLLDFKRLFASLEQHNYAATVAYIPWNHLRTSGHDVPLFQTPGERFTVCIHGCDHTKNEYGALDEKVLLYKSQLAFKRMYNHQKRTGLGFEPVMVFPQGRFSQCSLRALRASGFLAAVNTSHFPVDNDLKFASLGDLMLPAFSNGRGVPVFGRHYPGSSFPFLFDLFIGRPAFIVEHHDFFDKGFPVIEALVDQLNACQPGLSWGTLQETIETTCWQRALSSELWEVRFFTDRFRLTNRSNKSLSYRLWKQERDLETTSGVSVGDHRKPMERVGDTLQIELVLHPGETACVQVNPAPSRLVPSSKEGSLYAGKVLFRRMLSEFRDGVLVKHPVLLSTAKKLMRVLKTSSDSVPQTSHDTSAGPQT